MASLTTDLSRIRSSFVIGRPAAFTYKGKVIDLKQIGRELNVRYVLEGPVQRGGDRLRVNVQLIDAETGNHLWAERFDKPVADLFDMQDEIVSRLANSLCVGSSYRSSAVRILALPLRIPHLPPQCHALKSESGRHSLTATANPEKCTRAKEEDPMKFRPLHDRVVVKRIDAEEKTAGGIIIPDSAKEKPSQGEVIAVGPGGRDESGKLIPIDIQVGDRVLFGKWSGTEVKIDGQELLIMKESDIMGVLTDVGGSKKKAA
jgi:chaperonin GroES